MAIRGTHEARGSGLSQFGQFYFGWVWGGCVATFPAIGTAKHLRARAQGCRAKFCADNDWNRIGIEEVAASLAQVVQEGI